jgi:hypothetical protein
MSGLAGLYGRLIFVFLRSLYTVCHNGFTSLHSHQQSMSVRFLPASSPTFVGGDVLDGSYSTEIRWNLNVVLIWISFMAKNGKHFSCFF